MPGIVIEVSAIFVARMHFLEPRGARVKTFDCFDGWREEYMGYTRTCTDREMVEHRLAALFTGITP